MSDVPARTLKSDDSQRKRMPPLWLWFVAGFLVVFLGLSVAWPPYYYDGQAVHGVKLWQYYLLEIRRAWKSTGVIGPASGNSAAAATIVLQHVLFSFLGGAVAVGVGWMVNKCSRPG